jgi:predicted  nucleic acid-binding Zn-ribbon protein
MAIVKIFPEDQNRSDFSIRLIAEKYHVYEGDKLLRSNLLNVEQAVKEVDLIIDERLKNKLTSVKISHQGFELEDKIVTRYKRNHTLTPKDCANCGNVFNSIRKNHLTCSSRCSQELYVKNKEADIQLDKAFEQITETKTENIDLEHPTTKINFWNLETTTDLKGFEDLTRKAQSDKKRDHYFKDLISIIIGSRVYAGEMERKYDFESFYKNLLRMNLVFYNNVNIFSLMPSLFKVENNYKFVPVDYDLWISRSNQEQAVKDVLKCMLEMGTYPTHPQQNAFSSFAVMKDIFDDVVMLNNKVETLLEKVLNLTKDLSALKKPLTNLQCPTNNPRKNWFKF